MNPKSGLSAGDLTVGVNYKLSRRRTLEFTPPDIGDDVKQHRIRMCVALSTMELP